MLVFSRPRNPLRSALTRLALAAAIVASPAALLAAEGVTLSFRTTAITAPKGCARDETVRSADTLRCLMTQPDGSTVFVALDEFLRLAAMPGKTPDWEAGLALAMDGLFKEFIAGSIEGASTKSATAAPVPTAKLPRGKSDCKSYTIDQSLDGGASVVRERGLYCAGRTEKGIVMTIASVAALYAPLKGQKLPADFDQRALKILSTYRMK